MTGHWDFTYGKDHVQQIVNGDFKGRVEFLAQNIRTAGFGDAVFQPYPLREINGVPVAVIDQVFPYTLVGRPRELMPDWSFGIRESEMQKTVDDVRATDAQLVVLLSRNGMDVNLKPASRVATTDGLLYRRGTCNGKWDQLLCDALRDMQGAPIAFSTGLSGRAALPRPGHNARTDAGADRHHLRYDHGDGHDRQTIRAVLEDVADNLFNPSPYLQQGGDMVSVGDLTYTVRPQAAMGSRIGDMRLKGMHHRCWQDRQDDQLGAGVGGRAR